MTLEEWTTSDEAAAELAVGGYYAIHGEATYQSIDDFIDETAARYGFDPTRIVGYEREGVTWRVEVYRRHPADQHVADVDVSAKAVADVIRLTQLPYG